MTTTPTLNRLATLPGRIYQWLRTTLLLVVMLALLFVGYRLLRNRAELSIYRQRLQQLNSDYAHLVGQYNQAVRRTAVTELLVKDGHLSVIIRTADGREKTIATPFDPAGEIYVDYVVRDGRLWIRRLFDARTPPLQGLLIDEELAAVDWSDPAYTYGKAVYRSLTPGRWIISVTGDGSLGLVRRDAADAEPLSPPPPVRDYPQVQADIRRDQSRVGFADLLRSFAGATE